jgi:hypothetical protein
MWSSNGNIPCWNGFVAETRRIAEHHLSGLHRASQEYKFRWYRIVADSQPLKLTALLEY